jgi:hypothetical protein
LPTQPISCVDAHGPGTVAAIVTDLFFDSVIEYCLSKLAGNLNSGVFSAKLFKSRWYTAIHRRNLRLRLLFLTARETNHVVYSASQ